MVKIEGYDFLNIDYFHQFTKGENVKIAVLDSEIILDHPEFSDRRIEYEEFIDSKELNLHGTAVSSLIVGNSIGVSPESDIYHMKMLSDIYGTGKSWDKAMSSALRKKVDLICMSIGTKAQLSPSMRQSIQTASDRGMVISAPSGNEGRTLLRNPADNHNVVAVGGVGKNRKISKTSNKNIRMGAYAPSENIIVANATMSPLYSNVNGTSFANAIFIGQASLIISYARSNGKEINVKKFLEWYNRTYRTELKVLDMEKVKEGLDIYLNV